eukprot:CAMPEP_0172567880 /NCGR_PEP_ID=MMETSP1067-20121228/117597_1 /TAXON_ID=265564 ORGANISM="Thalassiosira punctigera, Strain Tpunct2005C2" /NCGR_SAMPLE_ID=MMETSP1067 /ASSEMBLY_ACC=CAM_ASM_000444 /LENGTH=522 /DNA_ID=CAMNT_0013359327 /DNA_START=74 /DNA_END=1642 /DNA_ORIENTATION=+
MAPSSTESSKGKPQKKKKKLLTTSGSHSPFSASLPPLFRSMSDSEFVRLMTAELKRRGYAVAIQLLPETAGGAEEDFDDATERKMQSASVPNFPFYPSTVSISQKNADSWNAMFEKLRTYHAENSGALPLHNIPGKSSLVKWTKSQLTLWKRIKKDGKHNLSLDRIVKLNSLNLERGVQLQDDIRSCVVSGDGGEDGNISEQQMMLIASMHSAGKNKQKWQDKFESLRRYKEMHGHTNVPRSYDESLSKWCATQRLRCKELMKGDPKTPMTRLQFQALESIGFNMCRKRKLYDRTVLDKNWDDKYNELLQYKEKHGNCDVAVRKGYEEYKQLANWAGLQRRKYKAKQTGTKAGRTTGITDDQIKKLASVGFSFSLQDDFDTRFKHLVEFKKEFGHTKVPVFYTGYNNLGRWAKRMRDGIRNNEPWMDDVRKTRLLGIDFDIAARHVFGHKPKKKSNDDDSIDDGMKEIAVAEVAEPVEAQAVAAATTMARMDNTDFGRPSLPPLGNALGPQFFYHGYSQAQP